MLPIENERNIWLYYYYHAYPEFKDKRLFGLIYEDIAYIDALPPDARRQAIGEIVQRHELLYKQSTSGDAFRNRMYEISDAVYALKEREREEMEARMVCLQESLLGIPRGIDMGDWKSPIEEQATFEKKFGRFAAALRLLCKEYNRTRIFIVSRPTPTAPVLYPHTEKITWLYHYYKVTARFRKSSLFDAVREDIEHIDALPEDEQARAITEINRQHECLQERYLWMRTELSARASEIDNAVSDLEKAEQEEIKRLEGELQETILGIPREVALWAWRKPIDGKKMGEFLKASSELRKRYK